MTTTFRMSACGYCIKRLSYRRLGYEAPPKPPWLDQAAEEGKWHEQRLIAELRADDIAVYGEQDELIISRDDIVLLGHRDGIASNRDIDRLLEIKSMSQLEFDRWMRGRWQEFPWYADQLAVYMEASGLGEALYLVKNRNTGYVDRQVIEAADLQTSIRVSMIIERLKVCEYYIGQEKVPVPTYTFDPEKIECRRFCEFKQYCMPPKPVLAEDQEAELQQATADWRRGNALIDEGKVLMEPARATLRLYTELAPEHKMAFDNVLTSVYPVHRVSYAKKDVEARLPADVLAEIAKVDDSWGCRVTDLAKKEE